VLLGRLTCRSYEIGRVVLSLSTWRLSTPKSRSCIYEPGRGWQQQRRCICEFEMWKRYLGCLGYCSTPMIEASLQGSTTRITVLRDLEIPLSFAALENCSQIASLLEGRGRGCPKLVLSGLTEKGLNSVAAALSSERPVLQATAQTPLPPSAPSSISFQMLEVSSSLQ
jgi:hypothetical protein